MPVNRGRACRNIAPMEKVGDILEFIYLGKDITQYVEIKKADIIDNAGGELDSIEVKVNNPNNQWSLWKPQKNDVIELKKDGFTSGKMYIDEIEQVSGVVTLSALPIKQEAKNENTKAWENIRFLELLQEFATKHNLQLKTYGIENHLYKRINQLEMADFYFLSNRCLLEGYMLKITDNKLVIYSEKHLEKERSKTKFSNELFDNKFSFKDKSNEIYKACELICGNIKYKFQVDSISGPTLKIKDIPVYDIAEAERYSRNILRFKNKFERTMCFPIELNSKIAAGTVVEIENCGLADGKYFVYQSIYKLADNKTFLKLRQIPEGY